MPARWTKVFITSNYALKDAYGKRYTEAELAPIRRRIHKFQEYFLAWEPVSVDIEIGEEEVEPPEIYLNGPRGASQEHPIEL